MKDKINIEYVNFPAISQIALFKCFSTLMAVKYRLKVFLLQQRRYHIVVFLLIRVFLSEKLV